jgi:hypothetical protein
LKYGTFRHFSLQIWQFEYFSPLKKGEKKRKKKSLCMSCTTPFFFGDTIVGGLGLGSFAFHKMNCLGILCSKTKTLD